MTPDRTRLPTPRRDGELLIEPPPAGGAWRAAVQAWRASAGEALAEDAARRLGWPSRAAARAAVLADLADLLPSDGPADRPLVVTGHQAEFYHAGVWAKNLAADLLARRWGGLAVNLVVDHDAPAHGELGLPVIRGDELVLEHIPLPTWQAHHPIEQAAPLPAETWAALRAAGRADSPMARFVTAADAPGPTHFVGQFMAGRQAVEADAGVALADVPTSALCRGSAFRRWVAACLSDAEAFHAAYNRALAAYRRRHGFKGTQRPVPDLGRVGQRLELPFWIYGRGEPRRRLWIEPHAGGLRVFADEHPRGTLPLAGDLDALAAALHPDAGTLGPGLAVRPRALTLTLFTRLVLADLFIHGIGGAKYDEMTEQILGEYCGVAVPPMVCVSATLRMPAPASSEPGAKPGPAALAHRLRWLTWNPQHLVRPGDAPAVVALATQRTRAGQRSAELRVSERYAADTRRSVYREILALNESLRTALADRLAAEAAALDAARADVQRASIAAQREYFFAALPTAKLAHLHADLRAALADD